MARLLPRLTKKDFGNRERVIAAAEADGLVQVSSMEKAIIEDPENQWLVALAIRSDPDPNYHWYRRDEDDYWSHKPGTQFVKKIDESDNPIVDPRICDRGVWFPHFIGYFIVDQRKLRR